MSIIHDALKKVQKNMEQNSSMSNPINPEEIIEVLPSSKVVSKGTSQRSSRMVILLCSLVVIGVGIFPFLQIQHKNLHFLSMPHISSYFKNLTKKSTVVHPAPQTDSTQPQALKVVSPVTSKTTSTSPATTTVSTPTPPTPVDSSILDLQGIMAAGGRNVALINNTVYEEGAVVEGRKIIKIDLNAVTIEFNGKQEDLTLKK